MILRKGCADSQRAGCVTALVTVGDDVGCYFVNSQAQVVTLSGGESGLRSRAGDIVSDAWNLGNVSGDG